MQMGWRPLAAALRRVTLAGTVGLAVLGAAACEASLSVGDQDALPAEPDAGSIDVVELPDVVAVPDTIATPDAVEDTAPPGDTGAPDPDAETVDAEPPACPAGDPCDDGDPCTAGDVCLEDGTCAGSADGACDDGVPCTVDTCGPSGGCVNTLMQGFCLSGGGCITHLGSAPGKGCQFCDAFAAGGPVFLPSLEGSPCLAGDACTAGFCNETGSCDAVGEVACEGAGGPCLDVGCDPVTGCFATKLEGACDDGSVCTEGDACDDGACVGTPVDCTDDDPCSLDACDGVAGCTNVAGAACDDGDLCTVDSCDPVTGGCSYLALVAECDDGDACTVGETCETGECVPAGVLDCPDDGPCLDAGCDPVTGCYAYWGDATTCDDGYACTTGDFCAAGMCLGAKSGCSLCPTPETTQALKITAMALSTDGMPGNGLDVDGDPSTCAPELDCGGGVDNALAVFASTLNGPLQDVLDEGQLLYVVDLEDADLTGEAFPLAVYDTDVDSSTCDVQTDNCPYNVSQFSFTPDCTPYFGLDAVTLVDDGTTPGDGGSSYTLSGGGPGSVMTIAFALSSAVVIPVVVHSATILGTVTYDAEGAVTGATGIIAGATPKALLLETVEAVPPDVLPVPAETLAFLLDTLVDTDLDIDGDGTDESASVAITFEAIPGTLE